MRENACPSLVAAKPAGKEQRYERLLVASPGPAADPIAALSEALRTTRPDADVDLLRRAYDVAARCHRGQFRRSGDPYVTHPVSVATILAGLGADDQTLCAAILHDTVEDTPYTLTALSREFGSGIAAMVAGIMALDSIKYAGEDVRWRG